MAKLICSRLEVGKLYLVKLLPEYCRQNGQWILAAYYYNGRFISRGIDRLQICGKHIEKIVDLDEVDKLSEFFQDLTIKEIR